MHYVLRQIILVIAISVSLASCISPLDPDTPRLRIEDTGGIIVPPRVPRIHPRQVIIQVVSRADIWFFSVRDSLVEIDTSATPPIVWMHLHLKRIGIPPKLPFLEEMDVAIDSLPANDRHRDVRDDPASTNVPFESHAFYVYAADKDSTGKVRFYQTRNNTLNDAPTRISFRWDSRNKFIQGNLSGEIFHLKRPLLSYDALITIIY